MPIWSCATCLVEHPDTPEPPDVCAICSDERQWVPRTGQAWTTHGELVADGHLNEVGELEPGLQSIATTPSLGIGQRGLLLRTAAGNLLFDPPGLADERSIDAVRGQGGLAVIASSHPHLTGASIQWSHAFGRVPVLVNADDQQWIRRPDPVVELWRGERELLPGVTMIQVGGHFAGSSVVRWADGADGRGALLTGDTLGINPDGSVTVMRSFPNRIPLPEGIVRRILDQVRQLEFDRIYDAWGSIDAGGHATTVRSLERYIGWLRGDFPE